MQAQIVQLTSESWLLQHQVSQLCAENTMLQTQSTVPHLGQGTQGTSTRMIQWELPVFLGLHKPMPPSVLVASPNLHL